MGKMWPKAGTSKLWRLRCRGMANVKGPSHPGLQEAVIWDFHSFPTKQSLSRLSTGLARLQVLRLVLSELTKHLALEKS